MLTRDDKLSSPTFNRTVTNQQSLINCVQKTYNLLKIMDLNPEILSKLPPRQIKSISKITSLYFVNQNFLNMLSLYKLIATTMNNTLLIDQILLISTWLPKQ